MNTETLFCNFALLNGSTAFGQSALTSSAILILSLTEGYLMRKLMKQITLTIELYANPLEPSPLFPILANSDALTTGVWLPLCLLLWASGLVIPYIVIMLFITD